MGRSASIFSLQSSGAGEEPSYQATRQVLTSSVHYRESAGTGLVVLLKVGRVTAAAFSGITMDHLLFASLSPHPLLIQWTCAMQKLSVILKFMSRKLAPFTSNSLNNVTKFYMYVPFVHVIMLPFLRYSTKKSFSKNPRRFIK